MRNLLGRLFVQQRVFLLACALVLGFFEYLICALVASVDLQGALDQILMFTPPVMRTVIEQSLVGGSVAGVLAFGWNHPIVHVLLTAVAVAFGTRAVAGELENGAMEMVLAQPISRARYLATHLVFGWLSIVTVALVGVAATALGQRVYDVGPIATSRLLLLAGNVVLLQVAIYGLTLLFSTLGREAGRVAGQSVLVVVVSYFINAIATLWPDAAFMHAYSLHSYFEPRDILMNGKLPATSFIVLGSFAALTTLLAFLRFRRRDLP